ncbi:MAG: type II toxin-antitoxin system VapC family toxin [Myxococcaceae bacterium]|nr:type II toxin-antitoxin system VapC family toxin [Myxococcaceae bacterium]
MTFLLDTCVVSEFMKKRANPRVVEWLASEDEASMFLSEIVLGELEKGLHKLPVGARRAKLRAFIDAEIVDRFRERILSVDLAVWRRWGELNGSREAEGRPLPVVDALLASVASVHHLALVTRNESDFTGLGIRIVNPWGSAG